MEDRRVTIKISFSTTGHSRSHEVWAPWQDDMPDIIAGWIRDQQKQAESVNEADRFRALERLRNNKSSCFAF